MFALRHRAAPAAPLPTPDTACLAPRPTDDIVAAIGRLRASAHRRWPFALSRRQLRRDTDLILRRVVEIRMMERLADELVAEAAEQDAINRRPMIRTIAGVTVSPGFRFPTVFRALDGGAA